MCCLSLFNNCEENIPSHKTHMVRNTVETPLTPQSEWHLISPLNITPESYLKQGNDHQPKRLLIDKTNSPCQHLRKYIENSMEIMHTDVRM